MSDDHIDLAHDSSARLWAHAVTSVFSDRLAAHAGGMRHHGFA